MISLIKNELIKIFKKKSIFILLIIALAFTILSNVIYKSASIIDNSDFDKYYIQQIKEDIKKLDLNKKDERDDYISLKTDIDLYELKNKYKKDSWQRVIAEKDLEIVIYNLNNAKYNNLDEEIINEYQNQYDEILKYLNTKTWQEYVEYELEIQRNELRNADESNKKEIENIIYRLNTRLEKNIPYANDYLNAALESYNSSFNESLDEYLSIQKENLKENYNEYSAKSEYKETITQNEENKYMIENKVDLNNSKTLRYGLLNTLTNNSIFILVITVIISGTIVASEFDKGTIKLLLIRPYSRTKILISKYIASIIIFILAIISVYILELIVGSLFFGFSDLNIPVIVYNVSTKQIVHIGIFKYIIDMLLTTLPQFILLLTLSFAISTIICNSAMAIAIPIIGTFISEILNAIIETFNIGFLKYFVTFHWDLSQYLYGAPIKYKGFSLELSILICIIYWLVMIIPTFIIFKKKNIKNI